MSPQALEKVPEDLRDIVAKMGGDPFCVPPPPKPDRVEIIDAEFQKLLDQINAIGALKVINSPGWVSMSGTGTTIDHLAGTTSIYSFPDTSNMRGVATTFLLPVDPFTNNTDTGTFHRPVKPHENNPHLKPKHTLKDNL